AKPNVTFLGHISDAEVAAEMARCKAFVFSAFEDYGLVPLEAQAAGRPVIAFGAGGVLDTVIEGKTGIFFREQTLDSLCEALERFERMEFDAKAIRHHAEGFSREAYKARMMSLIEDAVAKRR